MIDKSLLQNPMCLHELIAAQVARTPDAVAVTTGNDQLTYRELDRRANRVASSLRVAPDMLAGVFMERSAEMVIALLAVIKAGAAYVPFDPEYPKDRLAFMFRDSGVAVLLTQAHLVSRLPEDRPPVLSVDEKQFNNGVAPYRPRVFPDNLAYAIYTSGSTGQPKGAMNTHAGIVNRLLWMQSEYQLCSDDHVLQKTPFSFDVSVWEFFWPLMTGARLVMARPGGHRDSAYLVKLVCEQEITTLHFVPSMLGIFLDEPEVGRCSQIRRMICSGEALPLALQQRYFARLGTELHNLYGPTEAAVDVTFWACERNSTRRTVPIGRAITNIQMYVLDQHFQPANVGSAGELYIGGIGLARGYLHRPGLTAERFVPNPHGSQPGQRLYRTGDLARWTVDGVLEYLGRTDFQVKLPGGVRVELGEIESLLLAYPGIQDALVIALTSENANLAARLVAYVVPSGAKSNGAPAHHGGTGLDHERHKQATRSALQSYLAEQLPSYMLPAAIVVLESIPKTAHGKADRRALPYPAETDFRTTFAAVPPRTRSEQAIADAWREVLGIKSIGVDDNFFALGGSSLQVPRTLLLIREWLGLEIPAGIFFATLTLGKLAEYAENVLRQASGAPYEFITRTPRDSPLTLAPQQETWWRNAYLTDKINPNNVHFAVRIEGLFQPRAIEQAAAILQARHEAFRTIFKVRGDDSGAPVILDVNARKLQMAFVDLSDYPAELHPAALDSISQQENTQPFDLTVGPLCRAALVQLGQDRYVLMFTLHHLVCDGWSYDVLLKELATLYTQIVSGEPAGLPELPFQYVDFARWQRNWLAGEGPCEQLSYWQRQLASPLPDLFSPLSSNGQPAFACFSIRCRTFFELSPGMTEAARRFACNERSTLFSMLVAALQLTLYHHTGQLDIRLGTLAANRSLPGTERVVGLFTNVVCLRTHIDPLLPFRSLVRSAHTTIGDALANQDVPFDFLAQFLKALHYTTRSSLFQAIVLWGATPSGPLSFPGCQTQVYQPDDRNPVVMARNTLDLKFELEDAGTSVKGSVTYNPACFSTEDIQNLLNAFKGCITASEDDPEIKVHEICERLEQSRAWQTLNSGPEQMEGSATVR